MEILLHMPWWIWLLLSVVPYSIKRQRTPNMQSLVLCALFWQFSFKYQKRSYSWSFSLPWVKQIQHTRQLQMIFTSLWTKLVQEWVKKITALWK